MKWKVEVVGVGGNDRLLRDVLRELALEIVGAPPERFLAGAAFAACQSVQDVLDVALRVQAAVDEARMHDAELERELTLSVGCVWEQRDDGSWSQHLRAILGEAILCLDGATVQAAASVWPPSIVSDEERKRLEEEPRRLEEDRREQAYQKLRRKGVSRVVSAFHDRSALQVQKFLAGQLTPLNMGHIADLIESDMGGAMRELASARQMTRFSRSINHPHVFGEEARHIVSANEPPPDPMSLDEAREFIRSLASRWLERKAGL
jgi:hypothetical protein